MESINNVDYFIKKKKKKEKKRKEKEEEEEVDYELITCRRIYVSQKN